VSHLAGYSAIRAMAAVSTDRVRSESQLVNMCRTLSAVVLYSRHRRSAVAEPVCEYLRCSTSSSCRNNSSSPRRARISSGVIPDMAPTSYFCCQPARPAIGPRQVRKPLNALAAAGAKHKGITINQASCRRCPPVTSPAEGVRPPSGGPSSRR